MILLRRLLLLILLSVTASGSLQAQSFLGTTANLTLDFYQQLMSPVRQPTSACQFVPSCSQYAREAIQAYGPLIGTMMASDRLMRCGHSAHPGEYPMIGDKFVDPPTRSYLFGNRSLWGGSTLIRGVAPVTIDSVPPSLRLAFSLYHDRELDYTILELKRAYLASQSLPDREYLKALLALTFLVKRDAKHAIANAESIDFDALRTEKLWNGRMIDYLSADASDLDAWNASRVSEWSDSTHATEEKGIWKSLAVYSRAKSEEYDRARKLADSYPEEVRVSLGKVENAGSRSPVLGGIFSALLPGSGYLYAGRYGEAFSAFAFNALLGWGIYSLFTHHDIGSGILLSTMTLPFYLGNIVGATNAVLTDNAKDRQVALTNLRQDLKVQFYFSTDFLDQCWK